MADFLLGAAGFVLVMMALGLFRIFRGPSGADRMMAVQLLGTGGVAANERPAAGTGVDDAVPFELAVDARNGVGINGQVERQRFHRRQLLARDEHAECDRALDLFGQLQVERNAAPRIDRENRGQRLKSSGPSR